MLYDIYYAMSCVVGIVQSILCYPQIRGCFLDKVTFVEVVNILKCIIILLIITQHPHCVCNMIMSVQDVAKFINVFDHGFNK